MRRARYSANLRAAREMVAGGSCLWHVGTVCHLRWSGDALLRPKEASGNSALLVWDTVVAGSLERVHVRSDDLIRYLCDCCQMWIVRDRLIWPFCSQGDGRGDQER